MVVKLVMKLEHEQQFDENALVETNTGQYDKVILEVPDGWDDARRNC